MHERHVTRLFEFGRNRDVDDDRISRIAPISVRTLARENRHPSTWIAVILPSKDTVLSPWSRYILCSRSPHYLIQYFDEKGD